MKISLKSRLNKKAQTFKPTEEDNNHSNKQALPFHPLTESNNFKETYPFQHEFERLPYYQDILLIK